VLLEETPAALWKGLITMSLYKEICTKQLSKDDVSQSFEEIASRFLNAEDVVVNRFVGLSDHAQVSRLLDDWRHVMGIHFAAMDVVVSSLIASHSQLTHLI
jgi:hypothetical protein